MCVVCGWTWKQRCWLCRKMHGASQKTLVVPVLAASLAIRMNCTDGRCDSRWRVSSPDLFMVAHAWDRALFQSGCSYVKGNNSGLTVASLSWRAIQSGGCSLPFNLFPTASLMTVALRSLMKFLIFWQRDRRHYGSVGTALLPPAEHWDPTRLYSSPTAFAIANALVWIQGQEQIQRIHESRHEPFKDMNPQPMGLEDNARKNNKF